MSSSDPNSKPIHGGYNITPGGNITVSSGNPGGANVPTSYGFTAVSSGAHGGQVNYSLGAANVKSSQVYAGHPVMDWGSMESGDMNITFTEEEQGVWVKAKLAPHFDLTPREGLAIDLLITGIATIIAGSFSRANVKPISYIRKHNLERHFNISLV